MEITINLDLPAIISGAVSAERIQPIVDKAIAEAVKSAIEDATGWRSDFRAKLKTQLSELMPHGLQIADAAKLQLVANAAVTEAVHGANAAIVQAAIKKGLAHIMPQVPERISLTELLKQARSGMHLEAHESFYARLEETDYGSFHLYLDSEPDCRSEDRADHRISFTKDGDVYRLKLDGAEITPKGLPAAIGAFDGLLLSMYVARTAIDVDMDSTDVERACQSEFE